MEWQRTHNIVYSVWSITQIYAGDYVLWANVEMCALRKRVDDFLENCLNFKRQVVKSFLSNAVVCNDP